MPGIVPDPSGDLHFAEWNCRAGQNNVIIRTDGTVAPCFPMYASPFDWGNIDHPKFDRSRIARRLLAHGYKLVVFDQNRTKAEALVPKWRGACE
jgi:hypothetical protein